MNRLLIALLVLTSAVAHADGDDGPDDFHKIMEANDDEEAGDAPAANLPVLEGGAVRLPLASFARLWAALAARGREAPPHHRAAPAVVLGEAHYSGRVGHDGALVFTVRLGVSLAAPGAWKTVPLVGEDAILASATVAGKPIPVASAHGYRVWVTRDSGPATIDLEIVVPPSGPRGSTEFGFTVPRTPVTTFTCRFPGAGLEPHVDHAVESEVSASGGETVLTASLTPTTTIHLVGFHDLGQAPDVKARLYAETMSLVSVDETAIELFAIIRYRILYAGVRELAVELPAGVKVVAVEGRGGLRYRVDEEGGHRVLHAELESPVRDAYELSLRLARDLDTSFAVPLPRPLGVERASGWIAVEVPGKAKLEEVRRLGASAIDTRQLPSELVESAVSPILRAYHYRDEAAELTLQALRLPELPTAAESVDRVRAFSVVSAEGAVLTEMRLRLRNQLRQSVALTLAEGATVRSVLLDGQPVAPSRDAAGRLVLPLDRSRRVAGRLEPITVQVVIEDRVAALDLFGRPELRLPAVDLPVSALAWSVFLPDGNSYSELHGGAGEQHKAGQGNWTQPPLAARGASTPLPRDATPVGAGASPVRIELPRTGVREEHERYWIPAGVPATVSFRFARRWLAHPVALVLGLILVTAARLAGGAGRRKRVVFAVLAALAGGALVEVAGAEVGLCGLAAALLVAFPPRRLRGLGAGVAAWVRALPERYRADRERAAAEARALHELDAQLAGAPAGTGARVWRAGAKVILGAVLLAMGLVLADHLVALAVQLAHPLGG